MQILVGFLQNLPPERAVAWAETFRRHSGVRAVLFCHPAELYAPLARYGLEFRDCADLWRDPADPQSICKDRWDVMAREFASFPDEATVLVTDVSDVVFQRDPFAQTGAGITVATEGVTFGENDWGRNLIDRHLPEHHALLDRAPIICAGVWAAPVAMAREFCRAVYAEAKGRPGGVDQHAMNVVLQRDYAGRFRAVPYREAWCSHLSLMYPDSLNQGPRFEERPVLRDGLMLNEQQHPFAIVHHIWRHRWPELANLGRAA